MSLARCTATSTIPKRRWSSFSRRCFVSATAFSLVSTRTITSHGFSIGGSMTTTKQRGPASSWQHMTTTSTLAVTATNPASFSTTTTTTTTSSSEAYGVDMDQNAMMESDMLVVVDSQDRLVNNMAEQKNNKISKKQAHTFGPNQPRGICHRAFSLFLFNPQGDLLLTQRAASKITFPSVWTNTCCSHPLVGMPFKEDEVDVVPDAYPQFDGIKHAAIRKTKHELGITCIKHSEIQFLTRYHYWAADTMTHGPNAPWGEHEIDYILFYQLTEADVTLNLLDRVDPEEVSNAKFVSIPELKEMMQDPALTWSPWFLGIMERGGFDYWEDLDNSLAGKNTNNDITFFDPLPEHVASYNLPSHTKNTGVFSSDATKTTKTPN